MGTYRVYRLDGIGKIRGVEWLDALNDRFALEGARAIAEPGGCEVWQLARKIGRISIRDTQRLVVNDQTESVTNPFA